MDDEDTIELELTPEQIATLMRAAAPECAPVDNDATSELPAVAPPFIVVVDPPAAPALVPVVDPPPPLLKRRRLFEVQLRAIRVPAIVTLAVFALSLTGMKYVAMSREQDVPLAPTPHRVASTPPPATPVAAQPASPAPEPVHFTNPFDSSEVFDFPPGTSNDEARAATAELLIERARNRLHLTRVQ